MNTAIQTTIGVALNFGRTTSEEGDKHDNLDHVNKLDTVIPTKEF